MQKWKACEDALVGHAKTLLGGPKIRQNVGKKRAINFSFVLQSE